MTRGAKRSVALAIVLVVGAAGALASSSRATWPGKNGRIAYMVQDRAGHWQIWVANSDLSGAKKLTHGRYDSGWAVWSPDGKRLAFDSDRTDHTPNDSEHVNDVFVMKSSGSAVKKLTDSKGVSGDAAWSPDGKLIAFDADRGNRKGFSAVYVLPANGGKPRKVTSPRPPLSDYKPRFSPDGKHLVFTREHGTADSGPAALFTVRLDGSDLRRLTPYSLHADDSDWSPDGKRIVFDGYPGSEAFGDIYVVGANGGSAVDLTRDTDGQADPVWSPDGRKILFLDNRHVNGVGRTGLATMNADGSARQFVSSQNVEAHQADWESIAGGAQPHASARPRTQSELTLFVGPENGVAQIVSVQGNQQPTIWHCPRNVFCGEPVSFAWAPDGRRVAFTLDEIGGTSAYVGFHVLDVVSGHDTRIPGGAPRTASTTDDPSGWAAYFKKMRNRIGCWPAANLAWSADGSRLAYDCIAAAHPGGAATRSRINVLTLRGSGHRTVPTGSNAFWPSWSPNATRLVYSTRRRPSKASEIYTVAIDGSHRRLVARGGAAPAWSPDGRTIAYQTPCGIRLVTPSGRDVTPRAITRACRSVNLSGPPAWSPNGTKLAVGTEVGLYEFDKGGSGLHLAGDFVVSPTWYGKLPARPSWRPVR